jgi:uncharacterized protein (DUF433 family)
MTPVTSLEEARQNIRRYQSELDANEFLRNRIGYVRAWYAEKTEGGWIFAPSKFTGYRSSSAAEYLAESGNRGQRDGRETEHVLAKWYKGVEPNSPVGRELWNALTKFLAAFDQAPNKLARINRPKETPIDNDIHDRWSSDRRDELLNRISVDRDICGGRPCIKGTRMRVADIVEALAHGASQQELLADFDYLTAEDIAAALLYAAHATEHRVVRTA